MNYDTQGMTISEMLRVAGYGHYQYCNDRPGQMVFNLATSMDIRLMDANEACNFAREKLGLI